MIHVVIFVQEKLNQANINTQRDKNGVGTKIDLDLLHIHGDITFNSSVGTNFKLIIQNYTDAHKDVRQLGTVAVDECRKGRLE